MLKNSEAKIYFNNIHYHSRFEDKYGAGARELEQLVLGFAQNTNKIKIATAKLADDCYTEDGIHLTNKALAHLRSIT